MARFGKRNASMAGLVLVDLGDSTPVLRGGDALRVTRNGVRRLDNLADSPATVFWIAVDQVAAAGNGTDDPTAWSLR